ncbi:HesB/IscA family protein [Aureibacillus halotolerans]|uniref:Iron-sulfur cluster assembly protein n=1 Tax=Aureibacillus halotolerans TaxID=1508390 RepID=A0A4R6U6U1_9BACI|nr:iron-sulfur cluster assembly accessory protein [Aureibacillus halotolerans]TDQ40429.1 iron-sulfur cluster assembly protein [Aureibacillus halotolerans]
MIEITEAAAYQVREMKTAEGNNELFLRVSVKGGGCSGLSYGMGFEEEAQSDDLQYEFHDDIKVLLNKQDAPILKGTVIDYKQNMMGGGFTIENPNAVATCGCGSSFKTAVNEGTPEKC